MKTEPSRYDEILVLADYASGTTRGVCGLADERGGSSACRYAAIWSRLRSASFSRTLCTWLRIVCVERWSRLEISLLLSPVAMRSTTSRSRFVNLIALRAWRSPCRTARSAICEKSDTVRGGGSTLAPWDTDRMAWRKSSNVAAFRTNPDTPART